MKKQERPESSIRQERWSAKNYIDKLIELTSEDDEFVEGVARKIERLGDDERMDTGELTPDRSTLMDSDDDPDGSILTLIDPDAGDDNLLDGTARVHIDSGYRIEIDQSPPDTVFFNGREEILKICRNGDIYIRGELMENNREIMEGFKKLFAGTLEIPEKEIISEDDEDTPSANIIIVE